MTVLQDMQDLMAENRALRDFVDTCRKLAAGWQQISDDNIGPTDRLIGIENCAEELSVALAKLESEPK